jgi:hypothetical protein
MGRDSFHMPARWPPRAIDVKSRIFDPALVEVGEGAQHIDLESDFQGTIYYDPFGDMLSPGYQRRL